MKVLKTFLFAFVFLVSLLGISSCSSDDDLKQQPTSENLVQSARDFLDGDIVLSTNATMNGVNKTLLPEGCPTKFNFTWSESDNNTFTISLLDFTVGNMGMIISFRCDVTCMQLNSWEQEEYPGSGWIKFKGSDGAVWGSEKDGSDASSAKGSTVQGYYNAETHQIEFIVNYNMMNVRSECFLQTIDKNRINTFEQDKAQYEKDLAEYKKQHGL